MPTSLKLFIPECDKLQNSTLNLGFILDGSKLAATTHRGIRNIHRKLNVSKPIGAVVPIEIKGRIAIESPERNNSTRGARSVKLRLKFTIIPRLWLRARNGSLASLKLNESVANASGEGFNRIDVHMIVIPCRKGKSTYFVAAKRREKSRLTIQP